MYRNKINSESKNENTVSVSHGGQQESVKLITNIKFIEQTINKKLNFVPTQTNFNKTTLNKELEHIYRRIKLQAHFKNPPKQDSLY